LGPRQNMGGNNYKYTANIQYQRYVLLPGTPYGIAWLEWHDTPITPGMPAHQWVLVQTGGIQHTVHAQGNYKVRVDVGNMEGGVVTATRIDVGGGTGCPVVDARTVDGWVMENTISGRTVNGTPIRDAYRVRGVLEVAGGRIRVRVRENEQERSTID